MRFHSRLPSGQYFPPGCRCVPKVVPVCVVHFERVNRHARGSGVILHVMVSLLRPLFLRTPQHPTETYQRRQRLERARPARDVHVRQLRQVKLDRHLNTRVNSRETMSARGSIAVSTKRRNASRVCVSLPDPDVSTFGIPYNTPICPGTSLHSPTKLRQARFSDVAVSSPSAVRTIGQRRRLPRSWSGRRSDNHDSGNLTVACSCRSPRRAASDNDFCREPHFTNQRRFDFRCELAQ